MSAETFIALLGFALVASMTPGPNTMMLLASGVNFGFRRTVPHMVGITVGFAALILAIGFGLGSVFQLYPALQLVLKLAGGAYLVYLAIRIAMTRTISGKGKGAATPLTFAQAALFQWVNPKAWMMTVAAMAIYTDMAMPVRTTLIVAAVFLFACLPSVTAWAGFGMALRGYLSDPVRLRVFNLAMGALLLLSLIPVLAA
ncbi:MAG: LysE family translocator [Rhodobiaceae bacterium]|nr:LysE family translocator [Rhodobiaceae bacterium]